MRPLWCAFLKPQAALVGSVQLKLAVCDGGRPSVRPKPSPVAAKLFRLPL